MKYRIKYLIEVGKIEEYLQDYYKMNNEMNQNEEIEIEIKDNDNEIHNCIAAIRNNKIYIAISDIDIIKFKENNTYLCKYYCKYYFDRIKSIKDVIIEEIIR